MAQVFKFVNSDGTHRIVRTQANITVNDAHALNHDLKASWFSLLEGKYAKPKQYAKP